MPDPITPVSNMRELGSNQTRQQAPAAIPGAPNQATDLWPEQRVEVLRAAVEKLIKKSLPGNSKLQIEQDKTTGTFIYRTIDADTGKVIRQWPAEQLLELGHHLKQMEGMLLDKTV
jgi:flagellar protein FlaG